MDQPNEKSFASTAYDILGIPQNSPEAVVKQAYRRLALLHHPDKAGQAATAKFQEIDAAYRTVMNSERYDEEDQTSRGHAKEETTDPKSPKPEPQPRKPASCTETEFLSLHWLLKDYLATTRRTRSRNASPWVLSKEEKVNQWLQEMTGLYHKRDRGFEAELCSRIGHVLKALRAIQIATAPTLAEATRLCLWLSFQQMLSVTGISTSLNLADELRVEDSFETAEEVVLVSELWRLGDASPEASRTPGQSSTFSSFHDSKLRAYFQRGYGKS